MFNLGKWIHKCLNNNIMGRFVYKQALLQVKIVNKFQKDIITHKYNSPNFK